MPDAIPLTMPDEAPMVAIDVALLLHDPPVVVLDNVAVVPAQMLVGPVIGAGSGLTVITVVATTVDPTM